MKKSLKIALALLICALICVCGFTVMGGMNKDDVYKSDYCNTLKTVKYKLVIRENGENTLHIFRESYSESEQASFKIMDDFEKSGDYSSAGWQFYGDSEPYKTSEIKSVSVESGISVIGKYAFRGQSSIETVRLPSGLSEIKDGAFEGCTGIKTVVFGGTEEEWELVTKGADNNVLQTAEVVFLNNNAGDVNGDGSVDVCDCVCICLYDANKKTLTDEQQLLADVDGLKGVTIADANYLADYYILK